MKQYDPDSVKRSLTDRLRRGHAWVLVIVTVSALALLVRGQPPYIAVPVVCAILGAWAFAGLVAAGRNPVVRRMFFRKRLRVTRSGWWFLGLTLAVFAAALSSGANLLYLISGMLFSLILVSGLTTSLSFRGLWAERQVDAALRAGQACRLEYAVTNRKRFLASYSVCVEEQTPLDRGRARVFMPRIRPGERRTAAVAYTFTGRGLLELRGVWLSTRFPFGLFEIVHDIPLPVTEVVLPAAGEIHVQSESHDVRLAGAAGARRPRAGGQREFHGLREYREGDNPSWMDWKATARRGELMAREFERDRVHRVMVLLDAGWPTDRVPAGLFEKSVSFCASMAGRLIREDFEVSLMAPQEPEPVVVGYGRGPWHLETIERALAVVEPMAPADLVSLTDIEPAAARGAHLVLVTACAQRLSRREHFEELFENVDAYVAESEAFERVFPGDVHRVPLDSIEKPKAETAR